MRLRVASVLLPILAATTRAQSVTNVRELPRSGPAVHHGHRAPLLPEALIKLPVGSVRARGWLADTLRKMVDGMFGRLAEISRWCREPDNAWLSPKGEGSLGWEEFPYWLKGFVSLAFTTKDSRLVAECKRYVDAILASQREDGWFGPESNRAQPDLWPNMLVCRALQTWFEATGDARIVPFLTKYFRWQQRVPEERFLPGSWQKLRGGDNLLMVHWLHDRTAEPWLLELAEKTHRRTSDWTNGIPSWHGVNLCQGFREPAQWYVQSKDPAHLARTEAIRTEVYAKYGQTPGGMFGADENCRPGFSDPRQGVETCSMVEMMFSEELLVGITGDTKHADRCEDVAFNSLPATTTADMRALHYLTAPNLISCDAGDKHPGFENGGCMLAFSADERYRCCQHNAVMGWPYYCEHMWMATQDGGLAAVLLGPSEVEAEVAECGRVRIECVTKYPFEERLEFVVHPQRNGTFPIYVRVPGWAKATRCSLGKADVAAGSWLRLAKEWHEGDHVNVDFTAAVEVQRWPQQADAATVHRGPLTYAMRIAARWNPLGTGGAFPDLEALPTSEWRSALDLEVAPVVTPTPGSSPNARGDFQDPGLRLRAKVRAVPQWGTSHGLVGKLQRSPIRTETPANEVDLVPMGSAHLRIAMFPVVGTGDDARAWQPEPVPPKASHVHDDPFALNDGRWPANSDDHAIPRFTWWDHKGSEEWVQYEFAAPKRVSECTVYWFDDAPRGGHCRVPKQWQVQFRDGERWVPVAEPSGYGVAKDAPQKVRFAPVTTTALRLVVRLQDGWSGGLLEWECK